jgi:hypothetical protein
MPDEADPIEKKRIFRDELIAALRRNSEEIAKWPLWKQKMVPSWIKKNVGKRDIKHEES